MGHAARRIPGGPQVWCIAMLIHLLVQPEAAPSLNSLARTRKKEEDGHRTHKFWWPAHERRHGRTDAQIFLVFAMST
jgi:hypothetical protein